MKSTAPSSKRLDLLAMSLLFFLCASWGLQQVTIKVAGTAVPPLLQAGIRSGGAGICLVLWMLWSKKPIFKRDGSLYWGLGAGLLFSIEFMLIYGGLVFTTASRGIVFLYLGPFVVVTGARWLLPNERLGWLQSLGLVSAFGGILLAFGEALTKGGSSQMLIGDCMLVVAAAFWGATTLLIKASPLSQIQASKTLLYQLAVSAVIFPLGSLLLRESQRGAMTPLVWLSLLYQAVWVAFVTYLIWFWLIRHYSASHISSFSFLTPLFGVLFGGVLLSEPMTPYLLVSLFCVCLGIYLVNRR